MLLMNFDWLVISYPNHILKTLTPYKCYKWLSTWATCFMKKTMLLPLGRDYVLYSHKYFFKENHTFTHIGHFVQNPSYGATYNWFTNLFNDMHKLLSMEITLDIGHWVTSIHPMTIV